MQMVPPTVASIAESFGVSEERVRQICREHNLGQMVNSRLRILTYADVAKVKSILDDAAESGIGRPRGKKF